MKNIIKPSWPLLFACILFPFLAEAEEAKTIRDQAPTTALSIQADQLSIDKDKQFSRYTGHVQMTYADKRLTAEQVDIHFKDGALSDIIATGNPVTIEIDDPQGKIHGEAGEVVFSLTEQILRLTSSARLDRDLDHFSGEWIEYHMDTHQISAKKPVEGGEQVKMIIRAPAITPDSTQEK